MHVAGIPALPAEVGLHRLKGLFPDACGWLARLGTHFRVTTLDALAHKLGYQGPPELLSMELCLFMALGLARHFCSVCRGSLVLMGARACAQECEHLSLPPRRLRCWGWTSLMCRCGAAGLIRTSSLQGWCRIRWSFGSRLKVLPCQMPVDL